MVGHENPRGLILLRGLAGGQGSGPGRAGGSGRRLEGPGPLDKVSLRGPGEFQGHVDKWLQTGCGLTLWVLASHEGLDIWLRLALGEAGGAVRS